MAVQTSKDVDIENATYNEWLSEHFVSSVLMYSPKGVLQTSENIFKTKFVVLGPIIAANINVVGGGMTHTLCNQSITKDIPDGFSVVSDTAFPCGTQSIAG